jgi:hypothetical protein
MMYKKLSYVDEESILAEREDGTHILIERESGEIWALARSGSLGKVSPYVKPPEPTYEEKISTWRSRAYCEMVELQDAIIDAGLFEQAETLSKNADPKWRIRWEARAGIRVARGGPALLQYAGDLLAAAGLSDDANEWLDDLVRWTPNKPPLST